MAKVLIVYYSRTGNTERMARGIAEGVQRAGGEAMLKRAEEVTIGELAQADAFAFGSPTYFSYMAGMLQYVLEEAYHVREKLSGKPFAAFASGGGGEVRARGPGRSEESIERVCRAVRLNKCAEGVVSNRSPDEATLEDCRTLGERLVAAKWPGPAAAKPSSKVGSCSGLPPADMRLPTPAAHPAMLYGQGQTHIVPHEPTR